MWFDIEDEFLDLYKVEGANQNRRGLWLDGPDFEQSIFDTYARIAEYVPNRDWRRRGEYIINQERKGRARHTAGIAKSEPELALAVECLREMGRDYEGVELHMLRELLQDVIVNPSIIEHHRKIMPMIVAKILPGEDGDHELYRIYFSLLQPVVAALDAGFHDIAAEIYLQYTSVLEAKYLSEE